LFGNKKNKYHFKHLGGDQFEAVDASTVPITQDTHKSYLFNVTAMAPYLIKAENSSQAMALLKDKYPEAIDNFLSRHQKELEKSYVIEQENKERELKSQRLTTMPVSTTSLISDQVKIIENKGIVTSTTIEGVNVFRDVANEITGIVGGKSNAYMSKLEIVKAEIFDDIKEKTLELGGNAIIGFSFDIESLGTGGSGQLMATATGTAVVIEQV
jgi:uncharacterized protein YbjQ (UPF0145 family)